MKLAIMQPYLFPYLGYFQLVAAVDRFVFYDDVNFIKSGWINRNRLVLSGSVRYFTIPLLGASSFRKISDVGVQPGDAWRRKILESVRQSYSMAPNFSQVFELTATVLAGGVDRISEMAKKSVITVAEYLNLTTEFVLTSATYRNESLSGVERVLDICRRERALSYYNLPGGKDLYDPGVFAANGIELRFLEPELPEYSQGHERCHVGLSILDVLMWNDQRAAAQMLAARRPDAMSSDVSQAVSDEPA